VRASRIQERDDTEEGNNSGSGLHERILIEHLPQDRRTMAD
jgi:hypothetical protein